jgi:hypothetical protein
VFDQQRLTMLALAPMSARPINSQDMLLWRREEVIFWHASLLEAGLVDNIYNVAR